MTNDIDSLKVKPREAEENRTGYAFDVIKEGRGIVEFKLQVFFQQATKSTEINTLCA